MKPIEPGCLVLVAPVDMDGYTTEVISVHHENNANPVAICGLCGCGDKWWALRSEYFACACRLTRIDGGDPDAVDQTTEKEVTA